MTIPDSIFLAIAKTIAGVFYIGVATAAIGFWYLGYKEREDSIKKTWTTWNLGLDKLSDISLVLFIAAIPILIKLLIFNTW